MVGGTYRNKPYTCTVAVLVHFPFFFPVEQAVLVLHRYKLAPSIALSHTLQHDKFMRQHRTCPYVAYFPHFDQVVQRFHSFLHRDIVVESMNLENINIISV